MKTYTNYIIINGESFTNTVKGYDYKEALQIQRKRKQQSNSTFKGRLILSE